MSPKSLLSLSLLAALSAPVSAQVIDPAVRRGPLAGVGSLLTVGATPSNGAPIYIKPRGDQSQPLNAWPSSYDSPVGNYAMDQLFPEHFESVELDAMSSGNARIPTVEGVVQNDNLWSAVTISVSSDASGTPNDGWISSRPNPGADLATHYLPGSLGIHSDLVGQTYITQRSGHLGFSGGEDIKSLDVALGVLEGASGMESRLFFLFSGRLYFSLSPASAASLANADLVRNKADTAYIRPEAAAVYRMDWDHGAREWSEPREFLSPAELGLTSGSDNVDAIDVSPVLHGGVHHMVFSTQPEFGVSQLLVYEQNENGSGAVYPLTSQDGLVASDGFYLAPGTGQGLDNGDDVDAVCFFDPEVGSYDNLVGTAVEGVVSASTPGVEGVPLGLCTLWEGRNSYYFHVSGHVAPSGSSGDPGGVPGVPGSTQDKWVVIDYSTDLNLGNPNVANWNTLVSGAYIGNKAELYGSLPLGHGLSTNEELFFRAKVYSKSTMSVLLRTSWISALDF